MHTTHCIHILPIAILSLRRSVSISFTSCLYFYLSKRFSIKRFLFISRYAVKFMVSTKQLKLFFGLFLARCAPIMIWLPVSCDAFYFHCTAPPCFYILYAASQFMRFCIIYLTSTVNEREKRENVQTAPRTKVNKRLIKLNDQLHRFSRMIKSWNNNNEVHSDWKYSKYSILTASFWMYIYVCT